MATDQEEPGLPAIHRWVVVADSGFLPPRGGGEREHAGFVKVAAEAGYLAALVVPTSAPLDLTAYQAVVGDGTPVFFTNRKTSPLRLVHPRYPYVVASRPYPGLGRPDRHRCRGRHRRHHLFLQVPPHRRTAGRALGLPLVVRQHNREGDYHRSLAAGMTGPRRLVMAWEAWRIGRDERRFDRSPAVTAIADISADDAAARLAAGAGRVVHVPPFAFDVDLTTGPLDRGAAVQDPPQVMFLGALDVVTNRSALTWFIAQVWPSVQHEVPTARLIVVGSRPPDDLRRQLAGVSGAELHADVPNVRPYLARASVAVNPAVTGSGVNIKLVDYMQAGVPVVSTALATRGLDLRPGIDLEVHDEPLPFAGAIVDLLRRPERADAMAESGRRRITALLDPRLNLDRMVHAFTGDPDRAGHRPGQ